MNKPVILTGESSPQQVTLLALLDSLALPTAPYGPMTQLSQRNLHTVVAETYIQFWLQ